MPEIVRNIGCLSTSLVSVYTVDCTNKNRNRIVAIPTKYVSDITSDVTIDDFVYNLEIAISPTDPFSSDYIGKQIKVFEHQRKLYTLTDNRIITGSIKSYREVILSYADKGNWKYAFDLCMKVYKGDYQYLADVPTSKQQKDMLMHPFINSLVKRFLGQIQCRGG
jgi:hypothetical protein